MASQKLTCPECSTVLRPAKPVPAGKKVKCPRCETIFVAEDQEDIDHEAPTMMPAKKRKTTTAKGGASGKPSARNGGGKSSAKAPAKAEPEKNAQEEVYGIAKEETEEKEKERKPKIEYAPDVGIKDLRGPAVAILTSSANTLQAVGFVGFFGWLTLIVFLIIPAAFPLKPDKPGDVMGLDRGLGAISPGQTFMLGMPVFAPPEDKTQKFEEEQAGFFEIFGFDLWLVGQLPWYVFWPSMIPFVLMMLVSGLVAYGAIQMQNLESRRWGIAGCILAMLPFSTAGVQAVTIMCGQFFLGMVIDDRQFITIVTIVLASLEYVASLAIAIWALVTVCKEEVIAGFEYVAE
jgi:predicted Zn finger-like uncharacterized protein